HAWAASARPEPAQEPCPRPGRGTRTVRPMGPVPPGEPVLPQEAPLVMEAVGLPGRRACPGAAPAQPARPSADRVGTAGAAARAGRAGRPRARALHAVTAGPRAAPRRAAAAEHA